MSHIKFFKFSLSSTTVSQFDPAWEIKIDSSSIQTEQGFATDFLLSTGIIGFELSKPQHLEKRVNSVKTTETYLWLGLSPKKYMF